MTTRSALGVTLFAGLAGLGLTSCSSSGTSSTATSSSPSDLSWTPDVAELSNGTPPSYSAASVCGSDTRTYLAELANGNPLDAKVPLEWADIVSGGKQVLISGTTANTHLGPQDNPFTHPFGNDLSMDVVLDPQFRAFSRQLGKAEEKSGQMHTEITSGVLPHIVRASQGTPEQTWEQLSVFNEKGIQPGFSFPSLGDRVLVQGRWIIDCGHDNYGTELHPMSFVAWTHHQGSTTVAHAYGNTVYDSQTYTSFDGSSPAKTFPSYFVADVLAATQGTIDHLGGSEVETPTVAAPPTWQVCSPEGATGHSLDVNYDLVTRPGVDISVTPEPSTGCATVRVSYTPSFQPAATALRQCVLPWSYISRIAQAQYGRHLDIKGLIDKFVTAPAALAIVNRSPSTSCADALAGPTVNSSPSGRHVRVDASTKVPFYGVLTVSRH